MMCHKLLELSDVALIYTYLSLSRDCNFRVEKDYLNWPPYEFLGERLEKYSLLSSSVSSTSQSSDNFRQTPLTLPSGA